ncbi:MAG: SPOR domain-containing protein [Candidatus Omnitrophota bacterium]|nr:SPOR domain-containing protein [Candidatus Omnitrophota bacterium]
MGERQLHLFGFDEGSRDIKRRNIVSLSLDTFILLLIVVVLLFVLAFSLGVERGRKIVSNKLADEDKFKIDAVDLSQDRLSLDSAESKEGDLRKDKVEAAKDTEVDKETKEETKNYIIQIATYLKENIALEEAKKLKDNGHEVLVSKKGEFTVLFVGSFKNREQAQVTMQSLRKRYKDCFIRRLK